MLRIAARKSSLIEVLMPATTGVAVTATGTYGFAVAIEAAVTGDIFTARLQNIN